MSKKVAEMKQEGSKVASSVAERGVGGSLHKAAEIESHPHTTAASAASPLPSASHHSRSIYSRPASQWCAATQSYQPVAAPDVSSVAFYKPYKPRVKPPADPPASLPIGSKPLLASEKAKLLAELYHELDCTEKAIHWLGKYLPKLAVNDELAANKLRIKADITEVMNGRSPVGGK